MVLQVRDTILMSTINNRDNFEQKVSVETLFSRAINCKDFTE